MAYTNPKTKFVISQAQPIVLLEPHTPIPVVTVSPIAAKPIPAIEAHINTATQYLALAFPSIIPAIFSVTSCIDGFQELTAHAANQVPDKDYSDMRRMLDVPENFLGPFV